MSRAGIRGLRGYLINLSSFRRSEHMLFLTQSKQLRLRRRPLCAPACTEWFRQPPPQRCRDKAHELGREKTAGRPQGRLWSKWVKKKKRPAQRLEKSAVLWVIYYFFFPPINVPFVSLNTQRDVEMKGWWMAADEWWMRRGGISPNGADRQNCLTEADKAMIPATWSTEYSANIHTHCCMNVCVNEWFRGLCKKCFCLYCDVARKALHRSRPSTIYHVM